jgi:hypothetical protein
MGIRPFVAIRQDLTESAPNILESQMNGILVGPAVQEEDDFSERINVSNIYGSISTILSRAATEAVLIEAVGLNVGANIDFSTLAFGGKDVIVDIPIQGVYEASIKSNTERHVLKISLSADNGADGKVTIDELLQKGAESGDTVFVSFNNGVDDVTETTKARSFDIVDNNGVKELYLTLWTEVADAAVDETTVLTLKEQKNIDTARLSILDPLKVEGNENTSTSYFIDNTINPVDGSFSAELFVYLPLSAPTGPDFTNRIISTIEINTLSNYNQYNTIYKVTDGSLYNFFIANRVDIANNIFEVNTENYEEMLGNPTKNNKLSFAMKLISAEVPGASMKVYVTENDTPEAYITALEKLATSDTVYSVTALTDEPSVLNSLVGMVDVASTDTIAKWKMAVMCPRVPHFNKKIETDIYTITQIGTTNSFYVESEDGGFLTVGTREGDSILGSATLEEAEERYYDIVSETYSGAAYARVDSVVTDKKLIVTVYTPNLDLTSEMNGQNLIIGTINKFDSIRENIRDYVESISNHGVVSVFPDKYSFTVETESELVPGYYAAGVLNAAMAHLPPQQGLSNMSFNSIDRVIGSSFQFTDRELDEIASCGVLVVLQESYSSRPYVLRQLTTDMKSLESMEINKVRCLDYATIGFASVLDDFVGKRNVTDDNIQEISRLLDSAGAAMIRSTANKLLGSVLTWYKIIDVYVPTGEKDAVTALIDVETPTSLNKIRLFVTAGRDQTEGADDGTTN